MSRPGRFRLALAVQPREHRTMRASPLVVIEDVDDTGTHWFLSFDGSDPAADQCVRCVDRGEAFKLKGLIEARSSVPSSGELSTTSPT